MAQDAPKPRARTGRYIASALLFSTGCILAMQSHRFELYLALAGPCFWLPGLILAEKSELNRPLKKRDWITVVLVLTGMSIVGLGLYFFVPKRSLESLFSHPAYYVALWSFCMASLFLRWRKGCRTAADVEKAPLSSKG